MAPQMSYAFVIILVYFLSLLRASDVAASFPLFPRRPDQTNIDLTSLTNATSIVEDLHYTSNCTLAIAWYQNLPSDGAGAGTGNDTLNTDFLRLALPDQYQSQSQDQIARFYDSLSVGALSSTGWIGKAKDDIETGCIAPQLEKDVVLSNLNATQNCTVTAIFLSNQGWLKGPHNFTGTSNNDSSWIDFLRASMPSPDEANITDLELLFYSNYFLAAEGAQDITNLMQQGYDECQSEICSVQGYTGNAEIGGIGVSIEVLHISRSYD